MKKRCLYFFCLIFLAVLMFAPVVKAEVPFPQKTSAPSAEETFTGAGTGTELPSAAIEKTSLPVDPTFFAAMTGIIGLILGALITLGGAFAGLRLYGKRNVSATSQHPAKASLHLDTPSRAGTPPQTGTFAAEDKPSHKLK